MVLFIHVPWLATVPSSTSFNPKVDRCNAMRVYVTAVLAILNFIGVQLLLYGGQWAVPPLFFLAIILLVDGLSRKPSEPTYALALVGGIFNFMGAVSSLMGVPGTVYAAVLGSLLLFSAHMGPAVGCLLQKCASRAKK
jgi:purine-cytosine permease-like protein